MQISLNRMGHIIRFHRRKSGLTQAQLADLAGIGKTAVFNIEKGRTSVRFDTLAKVLSVLNITLKLAGPLMAEFEAQSIEEAGR
jgi:y4mF family transcriptional regulator